MATDPRRRRVLIAGWFSFDEGHATAGDLAAMELVRTWAIAAGCVVDVAAVAPFADGIDWRTAPPSSDTYAIVVCGPFARGDEMELALLDRFKTCRTLGVNLSMLVPLDEWSPFDTLLERDSTRTVRPDISLASNLVPVPLIGRCLVEPYGQALVEAANRMLQQLVESRAGAVIEIDTRLDRNPTDVLGWPFAFPADTVTVEHLLAAFDSCKTREAADLAGACAAGALPAIEDVRRAVIRDIAG